MTTDTTATTRTDATTTYEADARLSRRRLLTGAAFTIATIAAGTRFLDEPVIATDEDTHAITTTVGMITDVVRSIGAGTVRVSGLMGPGIDPHLYKPSAGDINRLGDAGIIFYGGLHLEGRMVETFEKIEHAGKPTVAVTRDIPPERLHAPPEFAGAYDPHVWFDVSLWQIATQTIATELANHFPEDAATVEANAAAYLEELDALDAWIFEQATRVPEDQRVLITAHDAFGYFGARYGFEVRGLQGLSTATEAGAGDVQDLAQFIVDRRIRALFVESSVPRATVEAVQEACRAKGWDVLIGGELFSDAMGKDGTPEGTYIGMVRANVNTIVGALLGEDEG
jgi:manganese/zinc/iron transport system substrate-binding protein